MAHLKVSDRSINLKATEMEDSFNDAEDEEEENEIKNLRGENRVSSVWKTGGDAKNEVLWKLEKLFSSFVTKLEDEERNEVSYETLLSAHKSITRATKLLTDNDNYTTRDFTIHIANKKWVQSTLVPLMELGIEDRDLTMRCCRLLMVLTRNLNYDAKAFSTLEVKPLKGKETREEGKIRFRRETISKENAHQQISAFLSFKEAICTEKCSTAITNVLYHLWKTEKEERKEREVKRLSGTANDFTKREVATCLSYIRRILQVDSVPSCSSPGEIIMAKSVHDKLVVQLRGALLIVPVICAELADKYNDVWLTDVLRIIFYILRGHDPKDFFQVWKENCLIGDDLNFDKENIVQLLSIKNKDINRSYATQQDKDKKTIIPSKNVTGDSKSIPLPPSFASRNPVLTSKGLLGSILGKERADRARRADEMPRHSRFGGQFRVATTSNTVALPESTGTSNAGTAKLVPRPFANCVPQAQVKRNKKNITFAAIDPYVKMAAKDSMGEDGQRACVVAATLAERICSGMGLKQLVMRVGVDRVREEGLISMDKEIIFFDVVTSLLKYNRLKIGYNKAQHENIVSSNLLGHGLMRDFTTQPEETGTVPGQGSRGGVTGKLGADTSSGSTGWIPDLHNVINTLDTMSFRRVFESLETLQTTQVKRFADMVSPLGLYKEMMCYLRILLESADETHNEFAIARLYSIFYTTSERRDPLPRILAEWIPGIYSRKHLDTLVELVHETLKTLDTAAFKYGNPDIEKKKIKQKNVKKAMDMEQYMVGCLSFDVSEYFKRYLATNATVRMFTRLLSYHATNDVSVNHYAFCYLRRLCSFRLQQDFPAPLKPLRDINGLTTTHSIPVSATSSIGGALAPVVAEHEDALTLGHMLFNISTLSVFTDVLEETQNSKPKVMEPLVRLIKSVIRRFTRAVQKNHQLLPEALFQHAHIQSFIMEIDSVFEAPSYVKCLSSYGATDNDREASKDREKYGDDEDSDNSEERGEHRASNNGEALRVSSKNRKSDNIGDDRINKKMDRGDNEEEEEEFNEADYSYQERITKQSIKASKRKIKNDKKSVKNRRKREIEGDSDTEREEDSVDGSSDDLPITSQKATGRLLKGTSQFSTSRPTEVAATTASSLSSFLPKANKNAGESSSDDLHVNSDTESADNSGNEKPENSKRKDKEARSRSNRSKRDGSSPVKKDTRKATVKWTAEEDRIVREQFDIFRGSRSLFEVISLDEDLMAIGNKRTALAVGRRIRDLDLTSEMDLPDEVGGDEATDRDVSSAPIDFGHSDDENDYGTEGLGSSAPGRRRSSLSDRLKDWDEDEDEVGSQAVKGNRSEALTSSKRFQSSITLDSSKKRKDISEDDESSLRGEGRIMGRVEDTDTQATQPQSQTRTPIEKVRKLQKKVRKERGSESDSDDEMFSDRAESSFRVSSADTIAQDAPSLPIAGPPSSAVGESMLHSAGIAAAKNSLRSRTMIVDSDED